MDAYVVRLTARERNPHEIVGIFVAESDEHLHHLIDECCDLDAVEYLKLGRGGIYWSDPVDFVVPYPEEASDVAPPLPGGATLSEDWLEPFFEENEGAWTAPVLA